MEDLLHDIWEHRLYMPASLVTTRGIPVSVIDSGIRNLNQRSGFLNVKLRIGDTTRVGNVEIRRKASDGMQPHCNGNHPACDRFCDSVILLLVGENDTEVYRSDGQLIPQILLSVSPSWLSLRAKSILLLAKEYNYDWNEVFYILLTRSFGSGIHPEAFERLARSLPLRYIRKQRGIHFQIEAMLFGRAGLLEDEPGEGSQGDYYGLLRQEYRFLRHKFGLSPSEASLFGHLCRSPHVRLAQLASLWYGHDTLFSFVRDEDDPEKIKEVFRVCPSDYWQTHDNFHRRSERQEKYLGESALCSLLVNAAAPVLFAYGEQHRLPAYGERAGRFLECLPVTLGR
ncbi:MAG: DUF2851 family protein [Tannerellaceae bacterium]|jgi:hypothetical protein|nr:DUF2851 family protein [Tannerellaceae bacterium]